VWLVGVEGDCLEIFSSILSALGISARHSGNISAKRVEAFRLNAEFEALINRVDSFQRLEQIGLMCTASILSEFDPSIIQTCEQYFEKVEGDISIARQTIRNNSVTISSGSGFSSLRKWDEAISIVQRQHLAAKEMLVSVEATIEKIQVSTGPDHGGA